VNKSDLISDVQKQLGKDCSRAHAEQAVNSVLASIEGGLKQGQTVQITGFGTFAVRNRKARMGRNPQTNEPIRIKASKTVGFKAGSTLKGSV
jgi:DNA-binding protein HU-beta